MPYVKSTEGSRICAAESVERLRRVSRLRGATQESWSFTRARDCGCQREIGQEMGLGTRCCLTAEC